MAMMSTFLSHAPADRDLAARMVTALSEAGADVWFDEYNLGAAQLPDETQRQLAARPIFLVLLSPAAFASDQVRRECELAFNIHRRDSTHVILPVVIAEIEPSVFNTMRFLDDYQRVAVGGHRPLAEDQMLAETLRLLGPTPSVQTPIPVVPAPAEAVEDLLTQGKALLAQQRLAEALPFFQRATERDPRHAEAWSSAGLALASLRRHEEALVACERSLALNDQQAWVWINKGSMLANLQRYEEALASYDRALTIDPTFAYAWYNKGVALANLKRAEEALAAYDQALALDPKSATAWSGKGTLYALKRYSEALAAYDQALAIDPKNASAAGDRAVSLRALGRVAEAKAAERRAKELRK